MDLPSAIGTHPLVRPPAGVIRGRSTHALDLSIFQKDTNPSSVTPQAVSEQHASGHDVRGTLNRGFSTGVAGRPA
jgi:hypothetical protein